MRSSPSTRNAAVLETLHMCGVVVATTSGHSHHDDEHTRKVRAHSPIQILPQTGLWLRSETRVYVSCCRTAYRTIIFYIRHDLHNHLSVICSTRLHVIPGVSYVHELMQQQQQQQLGKRRMQIAISDMRERSPSTTTSHGTLAAY